MTKTNEELRELAVEIVNGRVYTDVFHISSACPEQVLQVFMPLALLNTDDRLTFYKRVENGDVAMIYEHLDKAGPMAIDGLPVFFSFSTIDEEELDRLRPMVKEIHAYLYPGEHASMLRAKEVESGEEADPKDDEPPTQAELGATQKEDDRRDHIGPPDY